VETLEGLLFNKRAIMTEREGSHFAWDKGKEMTIEKDLGRKKL
jgi:hypothetical protein